MIDGWKGVKLNKEDERHFAKELIIDEEVQYIGEGENPENNPFFQILKKALKQAYDEYTADNTPYV